MIHVNQIASWFYKNNDILKVSKFDTHLMFMCLLAKVAFHIKNIETDYGKIVFEDQYLKFSSFSDKNAAYDFNEKELHILKIINKHYGYYSLEHILTNQWIEKLLIKECMNDEVVLKDNTLNAYLIPAVSRALKQYQHSSLNEYTVIKNDKVFFIDKDIQLTEEEMARINNIQTTNQKIFNVFRDEESLVIM